jgi:alkanesulfonate monooxygenase SsuD/methylene tetrahydromethanopterin reductase-like flavin-dependent oxidoreductase (luciferase family)
MATATEHLGFGFTSSIMQYHPFSFARLITTLDHLTNGRVAWNIVTSFTKSAARNFGLQNLPEYDERYVMADEYYVEIAGMSDRTRPTQRSAQW